MNAAAELFRALDPTIWLVTCAAGERRGGLIATSVVQASIAPEAPRVLVGIAKQHATWELIERRGAFLLHLLPPEQWPLVERFGMQSGRDVDKFAGLDVAHDRPGGPRLTAAAGWLDCAIEARWDGGDRTYYLAEVTAAAAPAPQPLLTLQRLLTLVPSDWLPRLKSQLAADAVRDLPAISAWRQTRRGSPLAAPPGG